MAGQATIPGAAASVADRPVPAGPLRLNAGLLYTAVPELAGHDAADPARRIGSLLGPVREVLDGVFVVSRYRDCEALLRDATVGRALREATGFEGQGTSFVAGMDPPDHTRVRRLLGRVFTTRVVEELRAPIGEAVEACLDAFPVGGSRLDLARDFSSVVPLSALCGLIGVPAADRAMVAGWSGPVSRGADLLAPPRTRAQQQEYRQTLGKFRRYLRALIAQRRAEPRDDLVSRLVSVEEPDGQRLSEREIVANLMGLLLAGHETATSTIGHGLMHAIANPPWLARLAGPDDAFADGFAEELLRFDCPLQAVPRVARADLQIGGAVVPTGSTLILLLGIANRDPEVFDHADTFDPERENAARHLGLGVGIHYCLGAALGRLETVLALRAAAGRLIAPRLVEGGVDYAPGWGVRVPQRIEVDVDGVRPHAPLQGAA